MLKHFFLLLFIAFSPFSLHAEGLVLHEEDCEKKLVELIEKSKNYIDVSVYSINNKQLVDALIAAHRRGVKVRVLTDKVQAAGKSSRIWDIIAAKSPCASIRTNGLCIQKLRFTTACPYPAVLLTGQNRPFIKMKKSAIFSSTNRSIQPSIKPCSINAGPIILRKIGSVAGQKTTGKKRRRQNDTVNYFRRVKLNPSCPDTSRKEAERYLSIFGQIPSPAPS